MRLLAPGAPLTLTEVSLPPPSGHELLLAVQACGVCRTDLPLLDGELPAIPFPVTPGHEVVGIVAALGPEVTRFRLRDRVGVPRSEEHTSELQSQSNLVCRLLLEN